MNFRRSTAANPTAERRHLPKFALVGIAAAARSIGASSDVSASTDTTEPSGSGTAHPEAEHTMDTLVATQAVDGSAEASSPEAEAFCAAEVAAEARIRTWSDRRSKRSSPPRPRRSPQRSRPSSAWPAPANSASAVRPERTARLDAANCCYAELNIVDSEYFYSGFPSALAAGPTIVALDNTAAEVHELILTLINDDVTLSVDELHGLPDDEFGTMTTFTGIAFAFPGETSQTVVDLAPAATSPSVLPENADPEMIAQVEGPDSSEPDVANFGPPHFTLGMVHAFTVA